jgi:uncharacterized protein YndB with AHSA1/START domain
MARTDSASRLIGADAPQVFVALVDARALEAWLPPEGMTGRFEHFDARSGGSYRLVLTYDGGAEGTGKTTQDADVVDVRFLEVVPGVRIVQAVDFVADDPAFAGTMQMTWELGSQAGGTLVTIRAEHVPTGISPEDHAAGLQSSLGQLAAHLEQHQGPAQS